MYMRDCNCCLLFYVVIRYFLLLVKPSTVSRGFSDVVAEEQQCLTMNSETDTGLFFVLFIFSTRHHTCRTHYMLSPVCLSVRPSVCHTGDIQKPHLSSFCAINLQK